MKILSFNLWGSYGPCKARWREIVRVLPEFDLDVLCLQEATLPKYLDALAKSTHCKIAVKDPDSTGLAVLTRLPVKQAKLTPYHVRSPLENYTRKFQQVDLDVQGKTFSIFNTHLSWKPGDGATRRAQSQELAGYSNKTNRANLLCGDFNSTYKDKELASIRKGHKDLLSGTGDEKSPTWDNANPFIQRHSTKFPDRRIDLILANKQFLKEHRLKQAKILFKQASDNGLYLSDHYAVLTEFTP